MPNRDVEIRKSSFVNGPVQGRLRDLGGKYRTASSKLRKVSTYAVQFSQVRYRVGLKRVSSKLEESWSSGSCSPRNRALICLKTRWARNAPTKSPRPTKKATTNIAATMLFSKAAAHGVACSRASGSLILLRCPSRGSSNRLSQRIPATLSRR